jgi:RND family efflux transporter MFP subunit
VKAGQLMAEIESPEVDEQLRQSRHDFDLAQANLKLAQITAERYQGLFKTDSVSKQDVDNAVQNAAAQAANTKAAEANVGRLQQLVGFEKIYAPFDGIVTARNTDVGALIQSGPSTTAGSSGQVSRELFHVAAITKLRVFVNVPQVYSHETVPGITADLTVPELPGQRFTGRLVRTSNSFDPANRTLRVEVDVPNASGVLMPGAYAEAHFKIKAPASTLTAPATVLTFRSEGLRAAVVDATNHAHLIPVTLGRDFGAQVEITSGLTVDSRAIVNPPDALTDGELVRVVAQHTGAVRPPREVRTPQE